MGAHQHLLHALSATSRMLTRAELHLGRADAKARDLGGNADHGSEVCESAVPLHPEHPGQEDVDHEGERQGDQGVDARPDRAADSTGLERSPVQDTAGLDIGHGAIVTFTRQVAARPGRPSRL